MSMHPDDCKPRVHYTMGHETLTAFLEQILQALERIDERLRALERQAAGAPEP